MNPILIRQRIKAFAEQGIVKGAKVRHTFYYYGERGESERPVASHHTGTVESINPKTGLINIVDCKEAPGHYRTYLHLVGQEYGEAMRPTGLATETDNWRKPLSKIVIQKKNPMIRKNKK